jgi:hypothetical protein
MPANRKIPKMLFDGGFRYKYRQARMNISIDAANVAFAVNEIAF